MDINFDISQINQNTIFVSNISEKINQCIRDFEKLFSETQEGYDSIKKEISDILRLTDELINQADYLSKILGNKESKIPKDKDYIKKPIYQSFQNELAKQQKEYASNLGKTIEGVVANSQSVWLVIQDGGQTMATLLESVDVVKDMVRQNRSAAEKMETQINRFMIN
jgi:hypothetical protein